MTQPTTKEIVMKKFTPAAIAAILLSVTLASPADARQRNPFARDDASASSARPSRVYVSNPYEAALRAGSKQQCAHPGSRQVAQAQRDRGLCK